MTYAPPGNTAGIIVFAYRLLKGLCEIHKQNEVVLLLSDKNIKISKYDYLCEFDNIVISSTDTKITDKIPYLRGKLNRRKLDKLISRHNISLFFSPSLAANSLYTYQVPHIGVLHDAQVYILKKEQPIKGPIYRWRMNALLNRLTHIITISKASKSLIEQEIHPVPPISVIYNSVDIKEKAEEQNISHGLNVPYILYVNTLLAYKNLQTLIRAFALLAKDIEHYLVIKGSATAYWRDTLEPLINESGIAERVILIDKRFNEDEMAALYTKADLFVSPSLMEGFGFTPIEAAMYGTPVITSKIPTLYETSLGLLYYYEPATDATILANAIKRVINNPIDKEKRQFIAATLKEKYSTARQAEKYYQLFTRLTDL